MDHAELSAREAIRDLVARYNGYGDSGRFDELLALFVPDAVVTTDDATYDGVEAIRSLFTGTAGPAPARIRHFTSTVRIDLRPPDRASARCYFQVLTDAGLDHWGTYRDELVRVGDAWRFARRDVRVDGMRPDGWAARRRSAHGAPHGAPHDAP